MKAITKPQQREIEAALNVLREVAAELNQAIEAYNEALDPLREKIEAAVSDYNEKLAELKAVYSEIHAEAQAYYDDRSERWQESYAGQEYQEWLDSLESPEIEEIEIDLPEPLDHPEIPDFEDYSWLPPSQPGEL
jgi:hypothetical protein